MALLTLSHASKRFASGLRETVALEDVSLDVAAGECVAVHGLRRSGRTTLLRVAAGMLPLDAGEVRFDGRRLPDPTGAMLGVDIGWCSPRFDPVHGGSVADHVAVALLARGVGRTRSRAKAEAALARVGADACAGYDPRELHVEELVRAGIARALVTRPRLLLLDEPTNGVDLRQRDGIVTLLRSFAAEGTAVLMTLGEPLAGADRLVSLEAGRLRIGADPLAITPLRPRHVEPVA